MKTGYLLLGAFAVVTLAGPAKRDCPQFKCFNATNECGAAFSDCWDECTLTGSQLPRFTAPLCISSIADTASTISGTLTPYPKITSAPGITATPDTVQTVQLESDTNNTSSFGIIPTAETAEALTFTSTPNMTALPEPTPIPINECIPGMSICIDYITTCGEDTLMYGGCHDTCNPKVYTPPPCTLPPSTKTPWLWYGNGTTPTGTAVGMATSTKRRKAKISRPACTNKKSWMCAPLGW